MGHFILAQWLVLKCFVKIYEEDFIDMSPYINYYHAYKFKYLQRKIDCLSAKPIQRVSPSV